MSCRVLGVPIYTCLSACLPAHLLAKSSVCDCYKPTPSSVSSILLPASCLLTLLSAAVPLHMPSPQVKRLLAAGAHADTPNTDQRTALHVAAAAGSLQLAQVLIEEGKANALVKDRQGALPIDNARLVGAQPVVTYLQTFSPRAVIPPPPPAAVVPVIPDKDYSIPALPAPTEATGATHSALAKVLSKMGSVKPGFNASGDGT
jgi:hypothetical protein